MNASQSDSFNDTKLLFAFVQIDTFSTQNVIVRTSQPLCGPNSRRCRDDERILAAIVQKQRRAFVIDTRTTATSQSEKAKGRMTNKTYSLRTDSKAGTISLDRHTPDNAFFCGKIFSLTAQTKLNNDIVFLFYRTGKNIIH